MEIVDVGSLFGLTNLAFDTERDSSQHFPELFQNMGGQRVTSLTSSWSPNEFCQTWIKNLRF